MIYTSLEIPQWLARGIRPATRSAAQRKYIYGGDTETVHGEPMSFQFFTPYRQDHIWIDDPMSATSTLLDWCESLPQRATHVVYVHNLEFDMVSFFWDVKHLLVETESGEFSFACETWDITGVYGKPTFCKMTDRGGKRVVYLVDSYSYYRDSLARAAEVFCPGLPKLERPEGLGQRRFARSDTAFLDYAMRDSVIAYHIGVALDKLHAEFDIPQTVSVANMSARVFKRRFLAAPIMLPDRPIIEAALHAYHGGKNNLTVSPGWYNDVNSVDISSAYPDAMARLPSFYHLELYRTYSGTRPKRVPATGIYFVTGYALPCAWPILFGHDFKALRGPVENVAVTGFELNEALRAGEFKPSRVIGWYYDAEKDRSIPPMRGFVEDFYERKQSETDPAKRAMYKFILNSLSGKYVQTRRRHAQSEFSIEAWQMTDSRDLVAGGLFHPFIASLITGHTRAKIHRLEHEFAAIHTATDGLFTQVSHAKLPNESGLGGVVTEASGDLLVLRNKLYVLYSKQAPKKAPRASEAWPGYYIVKAALHGFSGSVLDLERMVKSGERVYSSNRRNPLRSSLQRGLQPNDFQKREFELHIPGLPRPGK